tara:strand:- start:169 stop:369 length:201 start_codon:yes stop_codon:yes gene_type:complete
VLVPVEKNVLWVIRRKEERKKGERWRWRSRPSRKSPRSAGGWALIDSASRNDDAEVNRGLVLSEMM